MTKYEKARIGSLVKRVNQRLRQIEKTVGNEPLSYSVVHNLVAQQQFINPDLIGYTRKGELKLTTSISKLDSEEIQDLEKLANRILTSKLSTISGIREQNRIINDILSKKGELLPLKETLKKRKEYISLSFKELYGSRQINDLANTTDTEEFYRYIQEKIDNQTTTQQVIDDIDKYKQMYQEQYGKEYEKGNINNTIRSY